SLRQLGLQHRLQLGEFLGGVLHADAGKDVVAHLDVLVDQARNGRHGDLPHRHGSAIQPPGHRLAERRRTERADGRIVHTTLLHDPDRFPPAVGAITQPMSETGHFITHVSDTARWTALHRATESARADALFSDPLAERLAGERGRAIVANIPRGNRSGWWLVARTKLIDDVVAEAIADGCDRVLNLAAGLDTRPYRLDLPPDLVWIEADLPQLLAEKTELLADQTPVCRLTRRAVDLIDPVARRAFFDEALDGASKALVITEGLLMYLEDRDVVALSEAIKRPEVAWWMVNFAGPVLKKTMNNRI